MERPSAYSLGTSLPGRRSMAFEVSEGGRLNPARLKLALLCRGMRLDPSYDAEHDPRSLLRIRAGLGSGLEIVLPDGAYVNAPVVEGFASESPYVLLKEEGRHFVRDREHILAEVRLPLRPAFYERVTSSGSPMVKVGAMQGTYLAVYFGGLCANWREGKNCRFCALGLHLGESDLPDKSVEDVVEVVKAARREERITFVHFNSGFDDSGRYLERLAPVVRAVKEEIGLLVGVQLPPLPERSYYHELKRLGVNNFSLCFELWNEDRYKEICPGKSSRVSHDEYLAAVEYCAREVRFDTTNGEVVAGLEDPEETMRAIDWMASVGAIPTVCIFRPLRGTAFESLPPLDPEEMLPVFARLYRACMGAGLAIGIAPNVKVSIVMLPEECRQLLPPGERDSFRLQRLKLATMRKAYGAYFRTAVALKEGLRT